MLKGYYLSDWVVSIFLFKQYFVFMMNAAKDVSLERKQRQRKENEPRLVFEPR